MLWLDLEDLEACGIEAAWEVGCSRGGSFLLLCPTEALPSTWQVQPSENNTEASTSGERRTPRPHGSQASHHLGLWEARKQLCPPTSAASRTFSKDPQKDGMGTGKLQAKPWDTQNYYPSVRKQMLRDWPKSTVTGQNIKCTSAFGPHPTRWPGSTGGTAFFSSWII